MDYQGITLTPMETQLLCLIVADERNDIYWSELEREENGTYIHRFAGTHGFPSAITTIRTAATWATTRLAPRSRFASTDFGLDLKPAPQNCERPKEVITLVQDQSELEGWGGFMHSLG